MDISIESVSALRHSFTDKLNNENGKYVILKLHLFNDTIFNLQS